jgi:dihydroorotate dehydrogenase (NAD+) catalytic subunit
MVWQTSKAVRIPIVGLGGISSATDAVEFLLAGASAVQVGTMNFIEPGIIETIADGLVAYCERHKVARISDLTGALEVVGSSPLSCETK